MAKQFGKLLLCFVLICRMTSSLPDVSRAYKLEHKKPPLLHIFRGTLLHFWECSDTTETPIIAQSTGRAEGVFSCSGPEVYPRTWAWPPALCQPGPALHGDMGPRRACLGAGRCQGPDAPCYRCCLGGTGNGTGLPNCTHTAKPGHGIRQATLALQLLQTPHYVLQLAQWPIV